MMKLNDADNILQLGNKNENRYVNVLGHSLFCVRYNIGSVRLRILMFLYFV